MLHRIVSRSGVVLAATAFLASCEDNTTGTPLTPPPASTAVYVSEVAPADGYTIEQTTIKLPDGITDTTVFVVSPDPVFEVKYPDGAAGEGQVVTFNLNLPGLLAQTKDTADASGLVSPGQWVVASVCPNPAPEPPAEPVFCRPTQSVIATPIAGNAAVATVDAVFPPIVPEP